MTTPSRPRVGLITSLLVATLLACPRDEPPRPVEREALTQNRGPAASTRAEPSPAPAAARPVVHGPAPASANVSVAERRAAALELLTDGSTARHLPLAAVDPGQPFDPDAAGP